MIKPSGILVLLWPFVLNAQKKFNAEDYYPSPGQVPLIIHVKVHVIQYSTSDPRNYTIADTPAIRQMFDLVNRFYSEFSPPTLSPPRPDIPFLTDSRIRFFITEYAFHVNENLWDRKWLGWGEKNAIDSIDVANRTFIFRGNRAAIYNKRDSIVVLDAGCNTGNYRGVSTRYANKKTYITVDRALSDCGEKGFISYRFGEDNNCSDNLFNVYGRGDDSVLHVFITGASYNHIAFGCGPSFQYLNMTNMWPESGWANSQLIAHELGHCLDLAHTNYPQFDDLPRKDRFGWIDCDTIDVSNNIMGYNKCRNYLSPKQIAWIHYQYSTDVKRMRTARYRYFSLKETCWTDHGSQTWSRNLVLHGNLVVRKNSRLVITGTLYMQPQATIYLEENATLEIRGGTVTSVDGRNWKGIVYCRRYGSKKTLRKKGKLILSDGGKTENLL